MIEEGVSEETKATGIDEAVSEMTGAQGKCIKQFVLIAKMNVKFHLSRQEKDLFTAKTVLESTRSFK